MILAQVTIELRHVLQMEGFELFDFEYKFEDENFKHQFEQLFKEYYYFYEIGEETIDRWKHTFKNRLQILSPYYNDLYMSTLKDIDPFITTQIKESLSDTTERTDTTNENTNTENNQKNDTTGKDELDSLRTDYPQSVEIENDIPTERAKNISNMTGQTTSTGDTKANIQRDGEGKTTRNFEKIIEGFSGNKNETLKEYRENLLNVNKMLIAEFKTLFILVY